MCSERDVCMVSNFFVTQFDCNSCVVDEQNGVGLADSPLHFNKPCGFASQQSVIRPDVPFFTPTRLFTKQTYLALISIPPPYLSKQVFATECLLWALYGVVHK